MAMDNETRKDVMERFLRYVKIDTASDPESEKVPSTEKQKDLGKIVARELKELGAQDIQFNDKGYLYATVPSNLPEGKNAPVIGLIAHFDTSPEVSGANVKPTLHENYRGGDISLPGDKSITIKASDNEALKEFIGDTIITSDGTTLLGADDKSGIAIILSTVRHLKAHPEIRHGKLQLGFTPDEEIGRGADHFDVKLFGADYAYTIDGSNVGEIENETFCADSADVTVVGVNVHPGYAKGKMANSMRAAAEILARWPKDQRPETTEKRQGFLHPIKMSGNVEKTTINFIVRDFEETGLKAREKLLEKLVKEVCAEYPGTTCTVEFKESYRNMRFKIEEKQEVMDVAMEGVKRAGIQPKLHLIRGGTDGARLCFMGLPTPNFFAGGQNFHSKREWVAVSAMVKAVEALTQTVAIWAERGK